MKRTRVASLILSAGLACSSISKSSPLERLKEAVEGYNHAYRWKNYENASQFLPSDLRGAFLAAYDEDTPSLEIEDFQVLHVGLENDQAATVKVKVRYAQLPSTVMKHATLVQHWHEVNHVWLLETEENSMRSIGPNNKKSDVSEGAPERYEQAEPSSEDVEKFIKPD